MESKHLKKILAGLCITGLVSGVGIMGCGSGAAACAGIPPTKTEKPKASSSSGTAQPKASSSCSGTAQPKAKSSCS